MKSMEDDLDNVSLLELLPHPRTLTTNIPSKIRESFLQIFEEKRFLFVSHFLRGPCSFWGWTDSFSQTRVPDGSKFQGMHSLKQLSLLRTRLAGEVRLPMLERHLVTTCILPQSSMMPKHFPHHSRTLGSIFKSD